MTNIPSSTSTPATNWDFVSNFTTSDAAKNHEWLINLRRCLEEEEEGEGDSKDNDLPICIFNVPKPLMSFKPDCFTPHQVSLGPYHYWRTDLHDMARHKLSAAKRTQKHLMNNHNNNNQNQAITTSSSSTSLIKFEHLVHNHFLKLDSKIRSCYHKYLDFKPETLAWIMAVDASFLLEFLQISAAIRSSSSSLEGTSEIQVVLATRVPSTLSSFSSSYLLNHSKSGFRKSAHNMILKDIIMLENQIPLFLMRKILEIQLSSLEMADEELYVLLIFLFKEISPIKIDEESFLNVDQVANRSHLLDFLYHMLIPPKPTDDEDDIDDQEEINEFGEDQTNMKKGDVDGKHDSFGNSSHVKQLFKEVWKFISRLNRGPILLLKKTILSKPMKLVFKLPWTVLSRIPGLALLKQPIQHFMKFSQDKEEIKPEDEESKSTDDRYMNKQPLMEEINIPSVEELYKAGIRFLPTNSNIESIRFDEKTAIFHLPILCLDVNSETVLRNLVAYEATTTGTISVFTRYTELMNGIIDTEEDAKLLRQQGVLLSHLKSDQEVAKLWNGMCRSLKLTKVPFLDKTIEDVNKYYSCRWKVKLKKFMKAYIYGSWQILTFLAALLLLLMTAFQAFCSIYSCSRILRIPMVELTKN